MINAAQFLVGQQGFTVGSPSDGAYGVNDLASLLGSADVLTGGDENFVVAGFTSDSIVTLGNGANAIGLIGNDNIVTLGAVQAASITGASGASAVAGLLGIGGAADLVLLDGTDNSLTVAGAVDAALIGTNNSMNFGDPNLASSTDANPVASLVNVELSGTGDHIVQAADAMSGSNSAQANIWGGSGSNYVDVVGNASIDLDGKQNTIIAGGGSTSGSHFDITAGSGQDYIILQNNMDSYGNLVTSSDVVRLAGTGNQVTGGSNAVITGGSGDATLTLGTGNGASLGAFDVNLGGTNNSVTLQNSVALELNAGTRSDTVNLLDSSGNLTFQGSNNMLFIGGGSAAGSIAVNDQSAGLHIDIGNELSAPLTITGTDRSLLIDFAPGASSFSSTAQIIQHLHSDGAGGMNLTVGTGSDSQTLIHFVSDTHLTTANFTLG